jgi:hypothetical protein
MGRRKRGRWPCAPIQPPEIPFFDLRIDGALGLGGLRIFDQGQSCQRSKTPKIVRFIYRATRGALARTNLFRFEPWAITGPMFAQRATAKLPLVSTEGRSLSDTSPKAGVSPNSAATCLLSSRRLLRRELASFKRPKSPMLLFALTANRRWGNLRAGSYFTQFSGDVRKRHKWCARGGDVAVAQTPHRPCCEKTMLLPFVLFAVGLA